MIEESDVWDDFSTGPGRHHETYESKALLLEELSILGWLRFYKALENALEPDKHPNEIEIHYIVSGKLHWWVGDESFTLTPGSVLIVRPNELHGSSTGVLEPCEHYWLRLKLDDGANWPGLTKAQTKSLKSDLLSYEKRAFVATDVVREAFTRMIEEHRTETQYGELVCRAQLHKLLSAVVRDYRSEQERSEQMETRISPAIHKTVCAIHDSIEEPMSIAQLAQLAHMSESSFRKQFKVEVGCSPHDYVIHRRVQKSKKLLLNSERSIIDIAFDLGFSSSQYFATVFKRKTGLTPKQFRERGGEE